MAKNSGPHPVELLLFVHWSSATVSATHASIPADFDAETSSRWSLMHLSELP